MNKKTHNFGDFGDVYSAYESVLPSENVLKTVETHFRGLDLNKLYIDINYSLNKVRRDKFEIELKNEFKNISRYSFKLMRRKLKKGYMVNGYFFFEDRQINILKKSNYEDSNFYPKITDALNQIDGVIENGRPNDYALATVIDQINLFLKHDCQTELKNHVVDSGFAFAEKLRFNGEGITLVFLILEDFKIKVQSTRTIFDQIKNS